jgi:two-component system response regulator NreC
MRRSLRLLLDGEEGVEVVAETDDLARALRHVFILRPRVFVVDLSMSNRSSVDAIRLLRREVPGTEVVVLTMEASRIFAQAALDAGAVGFVLKQAAEAELGPAVRSAAGGLRYVSPRLTAGQS